MSESLERALRARLTEGRGSSSSDAVAIAASGRQLLTQLAAVATPLIGDGGWRALLARAAHLVRREHAWLLMSLADDPEASAAALERGAGRQDPGTAADAVVALLSTITRLCALFIGEQVTIFLMRHAWPGLESQDRSQESLDE